jgi:DNA-binding beta-propeller fold protein YncE
MIVGMGDFRYRVVEGWGRGPQGRADFGEAVAVAVDSQDHVFITSRRPKPSVLVFDRDGQLLKKWGEDVFTVLGGIHSIWISPQDEVICADALNHAVHRLTIDGELLETYGTPGQPGAPGTPFNMPTKAIMAANGEVFVADGYGQERVHRFSSQGKLLCSWGSKGNAAGQFDTPHGIWVDRRGRVLVADRANDRLQVFDTDGTFLAEWTGLGWPNDLYADKNDHVYIAEAYQGISVFDLDGNLLARWGKTGNGEGPFVDMPHGLCVDSHGDLYVAEVVTPDRFQKFERV